MDLPTSLGQRITYYRKKAGVRQKDLASAVGITPTALYRYERDMRIPPANVLMEIAKHLNVMSDTLLGLIQQKDSAAKTNEEYTLLRDYRALNNIGRKRLLEYSCGLTEMPKYTKTSS